MCMHEPVYRWVGGWGGGAEVHPLTGRWYGLKLPACGALYGKLILDVGGVWV
jgi:hypothetical protein